MLPSSCHMSFEKVALLLGGDCSSSCITPLNNIMDSMNSYFCSKSPLYYLSSTLDSVEWLLQEYVSHVSQLLNAMILVVRGCDNLVSSPSPYSYTLWTLTSVLRVQRYLWVLAGVGGERESGASSRGCYCCGSHIFENIHNPSDINYFLINLEVLHVMNMTAHYTTAYHMTAHYMTAYHMTAHHMTAYHMTDSTLHDSISHDSISHDNTSHHTTTYHITAHYMTAQHTTAHHMTAYHMTAHHITAHHITAHHITAYHMTAYHITTHHITRQHIT